MDLNSNQLNKSNKPNNSRNSKNSDDFGVLLISHGSSLPYAEETFKEIAKKYIAKTNYNTEVGYMKVAEPSISKAIDNLLEKNNNITRIIAMPVFLAPGIHTNIDIPIILGLDPKEIDPRCPDGNYPKDHYLKSSESINFHGEIDLLESIGPDPMLIDIINKRISSAIKESDKNISSKKTAILLVSHGSRLKYNDEFITDVYNQYKAQTDYIVGQGFMELCKPTIAEAIDLITKENHIERIIVVPVFLAPGVHTMRDIPTILGILDEESNGVEKPSHSHSHTHSHSHSHSHGHDHDHFHGGIIDFNGEILYTDPLGSDDFIVEIIKERIEKEI